MGEACNRVPHKLPTQIPHLASDKRRPDMLFR
jgi:hypothetical protein